MMKPLFGTLHPRLRRPTQSGRSSAGALARHRPVIGQLATEHGSGLGKQRWVVEAAVNFHRFRRLRLRWGRDPDIRMPFLLLACSLMCSGRLAAL